MMIACLWRYLLRGSEVMYLPSSWLANEERLTAYDDWTQRQRESGVVSDVATMKRLAFRAQTEALRQERKAEQARVVWGRFA